MAKNNIRTVTIPNAKVEVKRAMDRKKPIFVWGPPGIGKSDMIKEIGKDYTESGKSTLVIDLRLALMEPTDMSGIPYFNSDTRKMEWSHPVNLPDQAMSDQYDIIILFLDEMNSAPPTTQQSAYQLVLDRRVGEYILPDNVVIVAAGNRENDRGVTYRQPAPLSNRFIHIEVKADYDSWSTWAVNNGIHPLIVGFLENHKDRLYQFEPKSNERAFPTPRSWAMVNDILTEVPGDAPLSEIQMMDLVAGTVGDGTAVEFAVHLSHGAYMPKPADVLSGQVTKLTDEAKDSISAQYSLIFGLGYELRTEMDKELETKQKVSDDWHKKADRLIGFITSQCKPEMAVLCAKNIMGTMKLPIVLPKLNNWEAFHARLGHFIVPTDD